jgi:hypothetical protein
VKSRPPLSDFSHHFAIKSIRVGKIDSRLSSIAFANFSLFENNARVSPYNYGRILPLRA